MLFSSMIFAWSAVVFAQQAGSDGDTFVPPRLNSSQLLELAEKAPSIEEQESAISLLAFHDPKAVEPRLVALAESSTDGAISLAIAATLVKLEERESARVILERLLEPNLPMKLETRVIASFDLSKLDADQGYPWLVSAARSSDPVERQLAAGFLPSFHRFEELRSSDPSPLALSIVLSKDEAFYVRDALVTGIGMALRAPANTEVFQDLLSNIAQTDSSEFVRTNALELLAKLVSKETRDLERH